MICTFKSCLWRGSCQHIDMAEYCSMSKDNSSGGSDKSARVHVVGSVLERTTQDAPEKRSAARLVMIGALLIEIPSLVMARSLTEYAAASAMVFITALLVCMLPRQSAPSIVNTVEIID